jgi:formylglycine-generating enzyme required for sulfatase activity
VFPHSEGEVAAYERAVASARARARNVRLAVVALVLAGMAVVGVVMMLAAAKRAEEARIEAQRVAEEARIEAARKATFVQAPAGSAAESPSLGMMQWIPAGRFTMGSPESEAGRERDEAQHAVTLTQGFWMMEHEVTQGEWQAVMVSNPSNFSSCGPTCPVEKVSWDEAVEFATRASARDGVTYRLPTEAEWEYAARGAQAHVYAGSDDVGAVGWYDDNSGSKTHPVCEKQRNAYGLCDMSGNVWEWTADRYGDYPSGSVTDPQGASDGPFRVPRGGSWDFAADYARAARRYGCYPGDRFDSLGLRLSRTIP